MAYDEVTIRSNFPGLLLKDDNRSRVYFDAPGGTQVPLSVINSYNYALINAASNAGGIYPSSQLTAQVRIDARRAMKDFLNANSEKEIVFGPSMTGLTYNISHSLRRHFKEYEGVGEIIVTNMEHDANVSPWLELANDLNLKIKWLKFDKIKFKFNLQDLENLVNDKTLLFAFGAASNVFGTLNDVKLATLKAKSINKNCLVFIDGVQYAPHHLTDVRDLRCDFFVCSMYKIYGPHVGVLWAKQDLIEHLPIYNARPLENKVPERLELGCLPHESLNAICSTIRYISDIGRQTNLRFQMNNFCSDERYFIEKGMAAIADHERALTQHFLTGLNAIEEIKIIGIIDPNLIAEKISTISIISNQFSATELTFRLANEGILTWSGNFYALDAFEYIGISSVVRFGMAHYNTISEIDYTLEKLRSFH